MSMNKLGIAALAAYLGVSGIAPDLSAQEAEKIFFGNKGKEMQYQVIKQGEYRSPAYFGANKNGGEILLSEGGLSLVGRLDSIGFQYKLGTGGQTTYLNLSKEGVGIQFMDFPDTMPVNELASVHI